MALRELALFAGAGGGILGGKLLGWKTVAACEIEAYPRAVLLQRQIDGFLPPFPIWDDVCTFDGTEWAGKVDIVTGGFPCQDISAAGKGAGIDGERSGLWGEMARIIGEVRPKLVFVENSPVLTSRGLGRVLGDMASMGYDAEWGVLGARDVGARHKRDRIWILGYTDSLWQLQSQGYFCDLWRWVGNPGITNRDVPNTSCQRHKKGGDKTPVPQRENEAGYTTVCDRAWWQVDPADIPDTGCIKRQTGSTSGLDVETEEWTQGAVQPESSGSRPGADVQKEESQPLLGRVADGVAYRMDRLKAIGNGQVPQCAAVAFNILIERALERAI